jgi:glycerophosphoryl diester phosphodiesterase
MKLAGDPLKVWNATLADLARIDIGSWFDPAFADQRTPTLAEALAVAGDRARVLIELKHYGHAVRLEERVAAVVEAAGMADRVAVMSLDHASAARMKALRPDWRVGLLAATAVGDLTRLPADFLAVNAAMATTDFIRRAEAAGKPVMVWTVNDPLAMSAMISRGAAGLITDEPALARRVLAERAEMTTAERLLLGAADLFALPVAQKTYRDASP